jgi:hypothetical protein
MRYYEKPINRADKDGERVTQHESKDKEIEAATKADDYCVRTDAFAEGDGYLGIDDLDRIRRDRLKHQTR